ncbi:insulinase family protein [Phenylobacterium sp.]|uniref:M16 family metallopeptidase n=1 Tax=Phenylobacterium sp. TaxID=1871053 RepID=UPI0025FCDCAC|nr:insulinase family protein [Phenylobacterium sp.]
MWRLVWAFAALAMLVGLSGPTRARAQAGPEIHQGRLASGLRYAVVSSATRKGALSVRLGIDVGAYEEADGERGLAHFVEHMAFNGTRNFAENALTGTFARMGVGFGRDQNAYTSLTATTFHLDLPTSEPAQVDAAFLWLSDVAEGMLFQPAAVDRERGVVLSEREARSDAGDEWRAAVDAFTYRGLRSNVRDPAGSVEIVRQATPAQLRAFYDRWYRPEHAVVVVVGDAPAEVLEARVKVAFSGWTGRGPAGVRAPRLPPQGARAADYFVRIDPHAPLGASVCRIHAPAQTAAAEAALRQSTLSELWDAVLEQRLKPLADRPSPAILQTRVYGDVAPDAATECVGLVPAKGRTEEALSLVGAELRRFERDGPSDAELEGAIEETRAGLRGGIADDVTQADNDRADALMYAMLDGKPLLHGREAMRAFNQVVADLAPQDLLAAFRADWSGWGPLVRVTSPDPLVEAPIRAAWTRDPAPATPVAAADLEWPYKTFGRPGRVVKREVVADPGFIRLTFSNGVVLNFKPTAFEGGHVLVKVRFGAGRSEIPAADYQLALLASTYFKAGGLGRMSLAELQGLTRGAAWDVDLDVGDHAFELGGEAYASGLEAQLHILAAYLTDPGFRPSVDALIPNNVEATFQKLRSDPSDVMGQALTQAITPGAPINRLPLATASAARSADFARILRPAITGAPLQVSLVGDVSEAAAIEAMSRTLAALPPRRSAPRTRPDTWFMRFPPDAPQPIRVTHDGARDKAMAGLFWPLFVPGAQTRRDEYALFLLGSVLEDQLVAQVRERLGKSYSPEAGAYLRDASDQGYLWAQVESTPADLAVVEAEARAVARRLQAGNISAADLEAARRPILAHMDAEQSGNAWWLETLNAADDPAELEEYVHGRSWTAAVTLDDVRRAAADWLKAPPIAVLVTPAPRQEPTS